MASEIERLVVSLEANIKNYERNLQKALGVANTTARGIEKRFEDANGKVGGLLKNFGAGFLGGIAAGGAGGLISTFGSIAKGIATIGDEAARAGLSTKSFQELKYVAEQNRIGIDSLVDGIKELNLRADEFITTGGGSSAESFQRLGYNATTLAEKLKDPSALFTEIIGKLGALDQAGQIRVADEVFGGNAGEKFVQLIGEGEAGIRAQIQAANDLGLVLDDAIIKRADEIDRKFQSITTTVGTNLKAAIVDAASGLGNLVDRMNEISTRQTDTLQSQLSEAERNLAAVEKGKGSLGGLFDSVYDKQIATSKAEIERLRGVLRDRALQGIRPQLQAAHDAGIAPKGDRVYQGGVILPGNVGVTPERRVDPYFGEASGTSSGTKSRAAEIGDSIAVALIKRREGFISNAKWDVDAYRAGYGSDTTTRANGSVERITSQSIVSLADANRDLARRLGEFQTGIKSKIGGETFASFNESQQAALTSIAYNYGELPDRIVKAIQGGNPEAIGQAIRDLGDDNKGINRERRADEANLFLSGSGNGNTPAIEAAKAHTAVIADLEAQYQQLGEIGVGALHSLADALADGKLEGKELLKILFDVVEQLIAIPGLGTGGGQGGGLLGGIFGALGGLFGGGAAPMTGLFATGGIAAYGKERALPRFAGGGVSKSAAIFGEAGPEAAVPLPDGRRIPVDLRVPQVPANDNRAAGGTQHVTVGVAVDDAGNLKAYVKSVTDSTVRSGIERYDRTQAPKTARNAVRQDQIRNG